jgi:hypothetical protein
MHFSPSNRLGQNWKMPQQIITYADTANGIFMFKGSGILSEAMLEAYLAFQ